VVSTAATTVSIDRGHFELNNFGVLAGSNSKVTVTNSSAIIERIRFRGAAGPPELVKSTFRTRQLRSTPNTGVFFRWRGR